MAFFRYMNWQQFVKDYLSFSKRDRIGIVAILAMILVIYLLPIFFAKENTLSIKEDTTLSAVIDSLKSHEPVEQENKYHEQFDEQLRPLAKKDFTAGELFNFDPNNLDENGWKKLGLRERAIKTIINYRNKGGKFYRPEDLQKIWGLPIGFYEYVKDHISIHKIVYPDEKKNSQPEFAKKEKPIWNIKLNSTDSASLVELPGIGSKLAGRIINFRDKLGGFYSVEQVRETYGLQDSSFQKIKPYLYINGKVKKININTATKEELKIHPYIKWNLANAFVEFRNQHGNFKSLDELKNIGIMDEKTFSKLSHYLSL